MPTLRIDNASLRTCPVLVLASIVLATTAGAAITNLSPVEDTFLRAESPNQNEGLNTFVRIQRTGKNRTVLRFDQNAIDTAVGGASVTSATLQLFVEFNQENWGTGREVDIHRMTGTWTETSSTWNCADDSNTLNLDPDCASQWAGGTFAATATDSYTQFSTPLTGAVTFDVTADVNDFIAGTFTNFGWLIKKRLEGQNGQVNYSSRENVVVAQRPILTIDFVPPTATATLTSTPTATPTDTPTSTPTATASATNTLAVIPTATSTATATPTIGPNCSALPLTNCKVSTASRRARLLVKNKADPKRNKLLFELRKGEETLLPELGDPIGTDTTALCIYDTTGATPNLTVQIEIPPGGTCDGNPCWKQTAKGFKYVDPDSTIAGTRKILLNKARPGRGRVLFKANGPNSNVTLPFTQDPEIIVQLKVENGTCWESRFSTNAINTAEFFRARSD